MISLNETTDFVKRQAKVIVESGEEHQPIMLVFTPNGVSPVMIQGGDKDAFIPIMTNFLRQLHAYAYIFINEVWSVRCAKGSPLLPKILSGEISVSELPFDDREELLIVTTVENGESYSNWFAHIQYTREGKRYLSEWEKMKGEVTGRLVLKEW